MSPDVFNQLLAGHGLSPENPTKLLTVERLHHLFLNQTVEVTDIRHHTGHGINGAMDRHEAVPLGAWVAILHRCERVTARDAGNVEPARCRHISVQIFILIQPNRVERTDGFLRIQLGPEDPCNVFRRGNPVLEVGRVQVQILMVKFFEHTEQDTLQIKEIHDHAGLRIHLAEDRHLDHVVMSVRRWVVAGAEHGSVLGLIPLSLVITMRRSKFDALCQ
ncbi:MAG: hypothetical protein EWM73_01450 [Nitrospira sp.]|nr:MAG: hypothetical protein EWM73_01450 [Nitrospira sp.]